MIPLKNTIPDKKNTLHITTPEGIVFSLILAGPVSRLMAWCIDFACIMTVMKIVNSLLRAFYFVNYDFANAFSILLYFVVSIGYGILFEWMWRGQTLGKRFFRLRVMDEQGLRLQFNQIVIRNLLRFIDTFPACYLTGGLICLVSPKAQRLGDIAANTIVTRTPEIPEPDLDQILNHKYNSFRSYPHLEARLRQNISPIESGIALRSLYRREELDPVARVELFRDLAKHFRAKVKFPQEATDGISDEQYIRNTVDTMFRHKAISG